jgi:hypothetical protein
MPASRRWWRPRWLLGSPGTKSPPDITIIVSEIPGGQSKYRAMLHDGTVIVKASSQPFHDAARKLMQGGFDPNSTLLMMRDGSEVVAMRGTLGEVARMCIRESPGRGPERRAYASFNRPNGPSAVERAAVISAGVLSTTSPAAVPAE